MCPFGLGCLLGKVTEKHSCLPDQTETSHKFLGLNISMLIIARLQSAKAKRIGLETHQSLSRSPSLEFKIGFRRIHICQYIEKRENT